MRKAKPAWLGFRHQTFHHLLLFLLQLFDQPLALVRELVALEQFLRVALESSELIAPCRS